MIDEFIAQVTGQTGEVFQAKNKEEAVELFLQIARDKQIKKCIASTDAVMQQISLDRTPVNNGIEICSAADFDNRDAFKSYAFEDADAGLTGVDYGVAESGTLCLVHDSNQPRLISLAPLYHIAFLFESRLVAVYEQAVEKIYTGSKSLPSQVSFITGPSMTADIQARPFKGMHGPRYLIVILIRDGANL